MSKLPSRHISARVLVHMLLKVDEGAHLLHWETLLVVTTYLDQQNIRLHKYNLYVLTGDDGLVSCPFISKGLEGNLLSHLGLEQVSATKVVRNKINTTASIVSPSSIKSIGSTYNFRSSSRSKSFCAPVAGFEMFSFILSVC